MKKIQQIILAFMLGILPIQAVWADNKNALAEYYNLWADKQKSAGEAGYIDRTLTLDKVKLLVEQGADINARIKKFGDGTALMVSSAMGQLDIVKYLISKGADINARDKSGATALIAAATFSFVTNKDGNLEVVKALVEGGSFLLFKTNKGADINARDIELGGATALMMASSAGDLEVVKYLISKGADVNVRTKYGKTALSLAKTKEIKDVLLYTNDAKDCDLGDVSACGRVGSAYFLGKGTTKNLKLAKSYLEKSCKKESSLGCFMLGVMYDRGDGVKQNLSKAKELFGKACNLGLQEGCNEYKKLNK